MVIGLAVILTGVASGIWLTRFFVADAPPAGTLVPTGTPRPARTAAALLTSASATAPLPRPASTEALPYPPPPLPTLDLAYPAPAQLFNPYPPPPTQDPFRVAIPAETDVPLAVPLPTHLPIIRLVAYLPFVYNWKPASALPPNWPQAYPDLTASKLGVLALNNSDPGFFDLVRHGHPRVVKGIDDVSWMNVVKQDSPGTLTLGIVGGKQEDWVGTLDPAEAAKQYIAANLDTYRLNPGVDFWAAWNEFNPDTPEKMDWYTQFEAARACGMQAVGLRAAVGEFGVGWPSTYADMGRFLPALQAAHQCGGIFTLHEYDAPTMLCGLSPANKPGGIPGAPALPVMAGSLTLRYRYWYEGYLKPMGIGDLPLVISEAGIDGVVNPGGCGFETRDGWKEHQAWWVDQGFGFDGPHAYVSILAAYDAQLRQDDYVLGATIFAAGATGSSMWAGFDLRDALGALSDYLSQQK
jgi:hypothetical protein